MQKYQPSVYDKCDLLVINIFCVLIFIFLKKKEVMTIFWCSLIVILDEGCVDRTLDSLL